MKVADVKARYMGETKTTTVTRGRVVMDGEVIREGQKCEVTIKHGEVYGAELFVHEKYVGVKIRIPGPDCCYAFMGELSEPNGLQQIELFDIDFEQGV